MRDVRFTFENLIVHPFCAIYADKIADKIVTILRIRYDRATIGKLLKLNNYYHDNDDWTEQNKLNIILQKKLVNFISICKKYIYLKDYEFVCYKKFKIWLFVWFIKICLEDFNMNSYLYEKNLIRILRRHSYKTVYIICITVIIAFARN